MNSHYMLNQMLNHDKLNVMIYNILLYHLVQHLDKSLRYLGDCYRWRIPSVEQTPRPSTGSSSFSHGHSQATHEWSVAATWSCLSPSGFHRKIRRIHWANPSPEEYACHGRRSGTKCLAWGPAIWCATRPWWPWCRDEETQRTNLIGCFNNSFPKKNSGIIILR